ncbi:hypothetical protein Tsubulata_049674 [Turnera subulata]|uniref:Uncharacterized protein n=1 Tax=Turnera subulata TaxID=218843 RepID=A0A9Q0G4U9_9ROSI|nr:hypothetical protein Tsubulata_049674 [Turnera subulata]
MSLRFVPPPTHPTPICPHSLKHFLQKLRTKVTRQRLSKYPTTQCNRPDGGQVIVQPWKIWQSHRLTVGNGAKS